MSRAQDSIGFIRVVLRGGVWRPDLVANWKVFMQLRDEAGLPKSPPDPEDAYDRLLAAAGRHNLGLEVLEP